MAQSGLNMSRRIRRTPYTDRVEKHGVRGFSVVNHMLLPKAFQATMEDDYWHLSEHVQIWDVSCQRQVELKGRDAAYLAQWMTPRNLSHALVGQCLYAPLIDEQAGMINDPVLLKLAEDCYRFSIADSDVLLWTKGLALGAGLEVTVEEPDVSPLAIQGPKAEALMVKVFGNAIRDIEFFRFAEMEFRGTRQIISRSGYSKQDGFEIYLDNPRLGGALWDALWEAGQAYNIAPGCPNLIDRMEAGLLSYGNEMTRDNNPLECGLARYCQLDRTIEYIGREALCNVNERGVQRMIRGLMFDGGPGPICAKPWPVTAYSPDGPRIGQVTTAAYSPRLQKNIGLSMIERDYWEPGQRISVLSSDGLYRSGTLSALPFE